MNYIGSKLSLLDNIQQVLDQLIFTGFGPRLDLFAGTGASRFLKARGHVVYANDWQHYSKMTCVAHIEHDTLPEFRICCAMDTGDQDITSHIGSADLSQQWVGTTLRSGLPAQGAILFEPVARRVRCILRLL